MGGPQYIGEGTGARGFLPQKRILDLPVRVVHGGHFPSFNGERFRQLIRTYVGSKAA